MVANGNRSSVLITGASGLVGRALVCELLSRNNIDIKAHVRNSSKARAEIGNSVDLTRVHMEEADFTRAGERELSQLSRGCEAVVHAAGLVHRPEAGYQEYEVVNVRATQQLAEAAAQNGAKVFVFLSSSAVYGPGPFNQATESATLNAKTPYAVSKLTSERWLQGFKGIPKIVILRPSLIFGEGDRGNLLSLIREIKHNRFRLVGDGSSGKSVIYSRDVAQAIALCLEKLPDGLHIFNVANPEPVSIRLLTDEIAKCLNVDAKMASVPTPLARLGLKAAELLMPGKLPSAEQLDKLTTTTTCSVSKLIAATGFRPRNSLASGLKAEIAWATEAQLL
jgi:nucleoside-diphosphate-sugar epimerase